MQRKVSCTSCTAVRLCENNMTLLNTYCTVQRSRKILCWLEVKNCFGFNMTYWKEQDNARWLIMHGAVLNAGHMSVTPRSKTYQLNDQNNWDEMGLGQNVETITVVFLMCKKAEQAESWSSEVHMCSKKKKKEKHPSLYYSILGDHMTTYYCVTVCALPNTLHRSAQRKPAVSRESETDWEGELHTE